METVFRYRADQPVSWYTTNPIRSNHYCLYCGDFVGPGSTRPSNREHLIARNFVPPGTLSSKAFNFLFRACVECNDRKAAAERHVSTVTLLTSSDPSVQELGKRKAERDFHPGTKGKLVKDATVARDIHGQFGAAQFTFGFDGPPPLHEPSAALLACNQIQALFSLCTTDDPRKPETTRLLPDDRWHPLNGFPFRDWGNPQLKCVIDRVADWPLIALINTANGYFKAVLRHRPVESGEWFWALEWNKSMRVVGAIFHAEKTPPLLEDLPALNWVYSGRDRIRMHIPLSPEHDHLFAD